MIPGEALNLLPPQNIQALKRELDQHETRDANIRTQVERQQHERGAKLSQLQSDINRIAGMLEQARQQAELAARYMAADPTSMAAGGALANANAIVKAYQRKLEE